MKVLFLDVDGVLNSMNSTNFKNNLWPIDDYMCFLVGKIQLDTDCAIVVSSSWRHHPDGMRLIREKFLNVIDKTPHTFGIPTKLPPPILAGQHKTRSSTRGEEIKAWLDKHPDVTKYAILDDDSDMLPEQLSNFFQTTFKTGLTPEIAKEVTDWLNAEGKNKNVS
jgi:hypothetical protein